jgi:hypothetical protein
MYVPLQSYQVGQLVRKIFPTIGRCKISVAGKRIWVYKNLGRRDINPIIPQISDQIGMSKFEKMAEKSGLFSPMKNSMDDDKSDLLTSDIGYTRQKLYESLPTMIGYWEPSEESGSIGSSSINSSNDYDNYVIVSAAKRRKTLMNSHTIDNDVVTWIRENYEGSDGFYVKSLELLAHYNSNNPRKPLQNLSQVGRLLKNSINQQCKHLRRYFKGEVNVGLTANNNRNIKGGKREWVYTNIRVKATAQHAFNKAIEGSDWMSNVDHAQKMSIQDSMNSTPSSPSKSEQILTAISNLKNSTNSGTGPPSNEPTNNSNSNHSSNGHSPPKNTQPTNFGNPMKRTNGQRSNDNNLELLRVSWMYLDNGIF